MIELRPSVVKDQIESGMTRKELQEHYGLSPMQMQAAIDEQPINNQQNYNL